MSLEIVLPLVIGAILLMQGFFFVRRINGQVVITWFGVHLRERNPVSYWIWRVYYFVSLIFVFLVAIGTIFGLMAD